MKYKLDDKSNEELQARIKELEEKIAADEERSIAGFGDAVEECQVTGSCHYRNIIE